MPSEEAKLFVAGLPDSISEDVLKQLFEATGGTVASVSLPKDRATGRPRGFGFVTMSTPAEAQAARSALDGSMQAGKSISVRPFQQEPPRRDAFGAPGAGPGGPSSARGGFTPGGPRAGGGGPGGMGGGAGAPDRTLYVGNLPYDCTQEEIEVLINGVSSGQVVRVHLPTDPDGRKRGFGFVTMASAETAKSAEVALRAADLRGRKLVVNLAHPKGERPAGGGGYAGGGGGGYAGGGGGGYAGGGGGGFGGGGGGFAGGGGGGSGAGGFPPASNFGPPRKTFDERRKKPGGSSGDDGAPRKRRTEGKARGGGGGGAVRDWKDDDVPDKDEVDIPIVPKDDE